MKREREREREDIWFSPTLLESVDCQYVVHLCAISPFPPLPQSYRVLQVLFRKNHRCSRFAEHFLSGLPDLLSLFDARVAVKHCRKTLVRKSSTKKISKSSLAANSKNSGLVSPPPPSF